MQPRGEAQQIGTESFSSWQGAAQRRGARLVVLAAEVSGRWSNEERTCSSSAGKGEGPIGTTLGGPQTEVALVLHFLLCGGKGVRLCLVGGAMRR